MPVPFREVRHDALFQLGKAFHMSRGQGLALKRGEHQLHLIQPGGVNGEPMDPNLEGQPETANPWLDLLGGMGGPIIQDEMQDRDPLTPEAADEHLAEGLKVHETLALKTAGDRLASMDQQRREEVEDTLRRVAGPDAHRLAGAGSQDAPGRLQGLDARLLIGADDHLAVVDEHVGLLVEAQDGGGLLQEAGIRGLLPRAVLPRFDLLGSQPGANTGR